MLTVKLAGKGKEADRALFRGRISLPLLRPGAGSPGAAAQAGGAQICSRGANPGYLRVPLPGLQPFCRWC